jgi:hypothetical protein
VISWGGGTRGDWGGGAFAPPLACMLKKALGMPKVVGSIPTVARHIFQACPVWIYTQSNITNIIFCCVSNVGSSVFH